MKITRMGDYYRVEAVFDSSDEFGKVLPRWLDKGWRFEFMRRGDEQSQNADTMLSVSFTYEGRSIPAGMMPE